jgi:hypothetical protein
VNADSERALADLVQRALDFHERRELEMTADPLHDHRAREAALRKGEFEARHELRDITDRIDGAAEHDIAVLAEALRSRQALPAATRRKLRDRLDDLQARVLPAYDESLWLLADEVRTVLVPDTDSPDARRLRQNTPRWKAVPRRTDPQGILPEPHGSRRPDSVVSWVVAAHEAVLRFQEQRREEAEEQRRFDAMTRAANRAKDEHDREVAARTPAQTGVAGPPPDIFDRLAWAQRTPAEGVDPGRTWYEVLRDHKQPHLRLVDATDRRPRVKGERRDSGGGPGVLGGCEIEVDLVPREAMMPAATEA